MKKKKPVVYDNQQRAAQLVRSWSENFVKEANGVPLLLIVGGKALMAEDIFANIAAAIDSLPRPTTVTVSGELKIRRKDLEKMRRKDLEAL